MNRNSLLILLLVSFTVFGVSTLIWAQSQSDVLVIANENLALTSISIKEINSIYLGKKSTLGNGIKVVPLALNSGNAHEIFLKKFLKKSSSQFSTFWKQAIFTGQGIPPRSFPTEEEMIRVVAETPGAIGYISADRTLEKGVKAIDVN
ncbi:MAG: hypothetical protein AB1403_02920 [Candidatus Riflebacteria bacterium]